MSRNEQVEQATVYEESSERKSELNSRLQGKKEKAAKRKI